MIFDYSRLKPNIATLYAYIGLGVAVFIGNPFSLKIINNPRAIPLIILCLLTLYFSSTFFGYYLKSSSRNKKLWWFLCWGAFVALATVFVTTLLMFIPNIFIESYHDIQSQISSNQFTSDNFDIPADQLPALNINFDYRKDFFKPLFFINFWGFIPASLLGLIYGFHSWSFYRKL